MDARPQARWREEDVRVRRRALDERRHAHSGIDKSEYEGFLRACPPGVTLVAVRVRQDRNGLRLFRYDEHPDTAKRGQHPVQRGVFWQRGERHGLLFVFRVFDRMSYALILTVKEPVKPGDQFTQP